MSQSNEVQADLPRGATPLHNDCGTAPGIWIRLGTAVVFSLPGVPHEMKRMFEQQVVPRLAEVSSGPVVRSRRLNCFGAGESVIGEQIRDLMQRGRNPEVGTTAQLGVVGIRVNARADTPADADRMLDKTCTELRRRLGTLIYGDDEETLADSVGRLLTEHDASLCVAESCTGGLLAKLLTDTPGSSRYFHGGWITYSNESKIALLGVETAKIEQFGAVSAEVARSMAGGARTRLGTTWALSITGVAGPGGGTPAKPVGLVYIGVADEHAITTHEIRLPENAPRSVIRERSAATALNLLRLRILEAGASPRRTSGR
jgi:nicotinamide-nucleotide amidase